MLESLRPNNVLPAALAAWALALLVLAMAGLGANFGPHPDDAALAPPLPRVELAPIESRLDSPEQYAEVGQRPLLNPNRRPAEISDVGEADSPLDMQLTGVLMVGKFRAAMLQSPDGQRSERVIEGEPVKGTSWRLTGLEPRAAIFSGPEGERRLELRLYDGSGDARPPPVAQAANGQAPGAQPPREAPAQAAAAKGEDAVMTEEQQVEAIRRRIEARRAQMREQAAREGQKVE